MKNRDGKFNRLIKNVVDPKDADFRNKLYVFLVCLGISIFIWFLIALSNESVTTLEYPVVFEGGPPDMVLVNNPDSLLTFRIASGGFELLTLKYLSRRKPLTINLENLNLSRNNGYFSATFSTSTLSSNVLRGLNFSEELVSISPENIYFRFEPLEGKVVPVVSDLQLEFEKQYRQTDSIVFTPPDVKVIGPRHLIESITHIKTANTLFTGISGSLRSTCNLVSPAENEQIVIVPDQVEFELLAEKYTESTLSVPVYSSDRQVAIKTFPRQVEITFLVSLENYKRVDPKLFDAVINISDQSEGIARGRVELKNKPSFVRVTKIEPQIVEYLVINP